MEECSMFNFVNAELGSEDKLGVSEPKFTVENSGKEESIPSTTQDRVVLKQLPNHLRYAFLGDNSTLPVIIFASLNQEEEGKLLNVLRKYRGALAWSIYDIKGISPTIYMHKILMEDSCKALIEPQMRLNPAMKEVVRAEVLKLLKAGIIYAILDSS